MTASHLRFRHLDAAVLTATAALLEARTSGRPAEQAQAEFQQWADTAAAAYGLPLITVQVGPLAVPVTVTVAGYGYTPAAVLVLPRYGIVALLEGFRRHMQAHGIHQVGTSADDARGWALSLYYQVRPRQLARLVAAGKIPFLTAADLTEPDPVGRIAHLTPADHADRSHACHAAGIGYDEY